MEYNQRNHPTATKVNSFLCKQMCSPKFCKTLFIPTMVRHNSKSPASRYDVIIGHDDLWLGFILDHAWSYITWDGLLIPMVKPLPTHFTCSHIVHGIYTSGLRNIKKTLYQQTSAKEVASQCSHLTLTQ